MCMPLLVAGCGLVTATVGPMLLAEDIESEKCHLSGIIVRDLAAKVSNYRASQTLDEYLKAQVRALPAAGCLETCRAAVTAKYICTAVVLMNWYRGEG